MKTVEIEVFPIAKTVVDVKEVEKWLSFLGANEFFEEQFTDEAQINGAMLVALAAKRCYKSFQPGLNPNITKVRKDLEEYLDNILKSGHGSVLEHAVYSFAIENVSRVFTGEMNRHRAGWAISEGSMRYIRFNDIPFWMPLSLRNNKEDSLELKQKKTESRDIFEETFEFIESQYKVLEEIWLNDGGLPFSEKKKVTSCLRRIIPMGVATGGVWTGNLRALRHVIALRTDEAAEEEICYVFGKIAEIMLKTEGFVFKDFERVKNSYIPKYPKV